MLLFHTLITWALMGLLWNVQIVQYPMFLAVGRESFRLYHFGHCLRITPLVVPLMLVEAATAAWLLGQGERRGLFLAALGLMVVAWLSTFVYQVPIHGRLLQSGWSDPLIRRLIKTNWLRTLAWTGRAGLLGWMCLK